VPDDKRPDPDRLLKRVQKEESRKGRLKLFFGANPGVGKTFSMLRAAQQRRKEGLDVVAGVVETHGRAETAALLQGLEVLPRHKVEHRGLKLDEFDLDAALSRKPQLLLVDELAHTNAQGSRHAKRWQDVQELIDAGIDVYTTLNVQHWESLNDVVAQITGVVVRETVPDTFLEQSHDIELVDIAPEDLLQRLKEGKIYLGQQAEHALQHFFKEGNLIALRELALRHTAERVDAQVQAYKTDQAIERVWPVSDRLLVGVTASPMSPRLVRATARLATRLRCEWIAVNIETPETAKLPPHERSRLLETLRMAEELGAETVTLSGDDVPKTMVEYAHSRNVSRIIVGKPLRPLWKERLFGSVVNQIAHLCGDIDLYVISGVGAGPEPKVSEGWEEPTRWLAWLESVAIVAGGTAVCWALSPAVAPVNLVMIYLLGVMWVAYRLGRWPSIATAVASVLCFDFFFVPPFFSFAVSDSQYLITLAVMLGAGLLISTAAARMRNQNDATFQREARTRALYRLSRELSETPEPRVMVSKAWRHLEEFYRTPVLLLLPGKTGRLASVEGSSELFGYDEKESAVAEWVFGKGQEAGAGTNTLAGSRGLYLPLRGHKGTVGVLGILPGGTFDQGNPDQTQLLETFASEIGAALVSTELTEAAGRAEAEVEVERLRNVVLSEFSSNLHEPLTQISKITSLLLAAYPAAQEAMIKGLKEIQEKAEHLAGVATELPKLIESKTRTAAEASLSAPAPAPSAGQAKLRVIDFLDPGAVLIMEDAKNVQEVIKALVDSLKLPDSAEALKLVLEREKAGATIAGAGLLIPHARLQGLERIKAAVAVVRGGLKAGAGKTKPVHVVLLFLSPAEKFRDHLAFLAAVSALFRTEGFVQKIAAAPSTAEIEASIRSVESAGQML
jgi:two-component system sensor histidine kinase KdpD